MANRPTILFDPDCRFCNDWVVYWHKLTGDKVSYQPSPGLNAVHLITGDRKIFHGAHAVFKLLSLLPNRGYWLWLYDHMPGFKPLTEKGYNFIADNRDKFYRARFH